MMNNKDGRNQKIYRGGHEISDEDGQEIDSEMAEQLR